MRSILREAFNARVSDVLPESTPLERASHLGRRVDRPTWIKREDLTPVFSFKLRGAYNCMAALEPQQLERGVIAASAGNHAQGVAYAARRIGCRARIVMPRTTPAIKVDAVRRLGAEVELHGDGYSDAAALCLQRVEELGMTLVHPFDDPRVVAGQATIGLELLRQAPRSLAAVLLPIGGGGLAAGVAAAIKELRPDVRVIGVEPDDSDAMGQSIAAGHPVTLEHVGIFADGVAVKRVGELNFELCREYLDDCITVSTDEICAAIEDAFVDTRSILEPAGALAIAGLKRISDRKRLPPGDAAVVASGANMSFARLGYVGERAEIGRHREALLAVTIPERPGSFLKFCLTLGERSVTEFNYRLASRVRAHLLVGFEIDGGDEARRVVERLRGAGYECVDLSADELAKNHVRHMVGGISAVPRHERLYHFEFPERPGALGEFLQRLGERWNISLFHYRNRGSAFGRVLCGLEVPDAELTALERSFASLGFEYAAVDDSPATVFLRHPDTGSNPG